MMTEQMDFGNIIRQTLRQWAIIVMAGVIAAFGCGIVASRMYRPQFETQAVIVVYGKDFYSSGISDAQQTADVFKEIISSSVLQKKVAEAIKVDALPGTITCENIPNTNMITMKVRAASPQEVMLVMNGILEHYEEAASQLLVNMVLQVLEEPKVPMQAVDAYNEKELLVKTWFMTAAGITFLFLLYYYLRDDIKNEKQVEQVLDTRLFASIYHEKRKIPFWKRLKRKEKVGILVNNPVTSFGYIETFQKLCSKLENRNVSGDIKIILVSSVEENEGKSTVSANLALSLAKRGKRVVLVDADLRKPAQFKLLSQVYKKNEKQIGDVFTGKAQAAEAIRRLQNGNIFLMGGNRSYRNATKLLASEAAKETFSRLRGIVDYVIVDTPPVYLAADTEELMPIADAALLVVRQNGAKVRDINDVIDIFKKTDCKLLGCVLNDVENSFLGNAGIYGDGYSNKYGYGHSYYKKRQESKEKA